jgi:hypothetical protein
LARKEGPVDISEVMTEFLKSPLLVAIVTVLGVKLVDFWNDRSKAKDTSKAAEKGTLWGRIEKLETELVRVNEKNDALVSSNAQIGAKQSFLEEQNKIQATQLARLENERDRTLARYEADHEALTKAQIRISELVNYVRILESRLRKYENIQGNDSLVTE